MILVQGPTQQPPRCLAAPEASHGPAAHLHAHITSHHMKRAAALLSDKRRPALASAPYMNECAGGGLGCTARMDACLVAIMHTKTSSSKACHGFRPSTLHSLLFSVGTSHTRCVMVSARPADSLNIWRRPTWHRATPRCRCERSGSCKEGVPPPPQGGSTVPRLMPHHCLQHWCTGSHTCVYSGVA